jgi:hypothetical protein
LRCTPSGHALCMLREERAIEYRATGCNCERAPPASHMQSMRLESPAAAEADRRLPCIRAATPCTHAGASQAPLATATGQDDEAWSETVRRGFVRKVLLLVFCQLLITTLMAITFYTVDPIKVRRCLSPLCASHGCVLLCSPWRLVALFKPCWAFWPRCWALWPCCWDFW